MGLKTIAIARGKDKQQIVRKLGAVHYIDSKSQNDVEELLKLGGAKIILGTGPGGKALSSVLGGLAVNGIDNREMKGPGLLNPNPLTITGLI